MDCVIRPSLWFFNVGKSALIVQSIGVVEIVFFFYFLLKQVLPRLNSVIDQPKLNITISREFNWVFQLYFNQISWKYVNQHTIVA